MLPRTSFRPQKCPLLWTNAPSHIVSSTKMPPTVDKCSLAHRFVHKITLLRGRAVTISLPHPQNHPPAWTGGNYFHAASTKDTLFVDDEIKYPISWMKWALFVDKCHFLCYWGYYCRKETTAPLFPLQIIR